MSEQLLYELLKIGLTEGEAKVYLGLSELGSSTIGPIVRKAGVASSNIYDILNRLLEKGIVSYIQKRKMKYFQASSPHALLEVLHNKEQEIRGQKKALMKAIPQIERIQRFTVHQKAEIFVGQKGLRSAYETHLMRKGAKTENIFFYIHKKRYAKQSDLFYFSIVDLYTSLPQRGIVNEFSKSSPWFQQVRNLKVRYVSFPIPTNIDVCGNSVLLVSWEDQITAVLIESKDMADNFRDYFNQVWRIAKS